MIEWGETEIMDICGYDACKILEEIAILYAIPQISNDYVYARVKDILIREKILEERDKIDNS